MLVPDNVTVAEYNTALAAETATHARITFIVDNVVFQDEELEQGGIQISTYMNPSENMRFGIAYSTEAVVRFFRSEKTDAINFAHEFTIEFGVEINGDIEWVKIGHFAGEKPVQSLSNNIIELIAYDRMVRFEKEASDFVKTLTFPCTIGTICDKLCDFVVIDRVAGDEIADVMNWQIDDNTGWESFNSCRDILASIAEATGCYARMTNNGELQFIWFADHKSEQTLTLDNCFSGNVIKLEKSYSKKWGTLETTKWKDVETIKYSEYDNNNNPFVYSYVRALWKEADGSTTEVVQPDYDPYYNHRLWANAENFMWESVESMKYKDFETADDLIGNTYTIDDNPFIKHDTTASIKTHLQDILDNLYVFHLYYVASVQMVGNWLIEPGDVVLLEIADNVFVEYPIFTRILSWNGSCECSYDTTGTLAG